MMKRDTFKNLYKLGVPILIFAFFTGVNLKTHANIEERSMADREISGRVTNESTGDGIPGVTVLVKGTTRGTVTDIDGDYALLVDQENPGTLVFSFIGYEVREIEVGNQSVINATLSESTTGLDEVVVVGYGTKKKSNLTGAVDDLNFAEEIGERPVPNITNMLQGTLPNLNVSPTNAGGEPGASNNLNIRGTGTLTGNGGSPFILLDGLPITVNQMNAINPNDVESISVLKDAASAAIYGARGAYGVILITTKKGVADQGVKVDYAATFAFAAPTVLPKMSNSLDFANAYNLAATNAGRQAVFDDQELQDIRNYQEGNISTDTEPNVNGNGWRYWTDGYANYDWYDVMFRENAPRQQHRLSVSGGAGKNTYYISGNFFEQQGNLRYGNDQYDRLNFTVNMKNQATDWLSFDISAKYARENQLLPTGGFGSFSTDIMYHQISRMWPVNPLRNPDGEIMNFDVRRIQQSGDTERFIDNTILQAGTDIKILPGLNTRLSYSWNLTSTDEERLRFRNLIPLPDGNFQNVGYNPDEISRFFDKRSNQLFNIINTYNKSIGDHNLDALVGYEQRVVENTSIRGNRSEFITSGIPSVSTAVGEERVFDATNQWSTQGAFARLGYNYKEKYLVEFNARYDGSSFFREGKRWGFFPSVSAGYNLAREDFWAPLENTIGMLKIRGSWGQLGNHDASLANLYQEFLPAGTTTWLLNNGRPVVIRSPGLVSPNLSWETVTSTNIGLDAALVDNRLEVAFDWFDRTTSNMIGPAEALPALLGANAPRENNAELQTRGWEAVLRWRGKFGEVDYTISANIGDNKTIVTRYNNPTNILSTFREGQVLGEIWGMETEGVFQSDAAAEGTADQSFFFPRWGAGDIQYRDLNGDGVIDYGENTSDNPGDRRIIGNNNPRYAYGTTLNLNYQGFNLMILVQGVAQRDIMFTRSTNLFWGFRGNQWQNSVHQPHLDFWTEENTDAYFPKPYMTGEHVKNTREQTRYLQNASYVRLKNIQLSYSLPSSLLNRIGLRSVQIFFSGENLLTFTNLFENFDPEGLGGGWGAGKTYPLQRVLSTGLNVGL
jgi:TonB-linked SusC/RagA family outer membrane protein